VFVFSTTDQETCKTASVNPDHKATLLLLLLFLVYSHYSVYYVYTCMCACICRCVCLCALTFIDLTLIHVLTHGCSSYVQMCMLVCTHAHKHTHLHITRACMCEYMYESEIYKRECKACVYYL